MTKLDLKPLSVLIMLLVIGDLWVLEPASAVEMPLPPAKHSGPPAPTASAARIAYHDGSFVGPVVSSYYGDVQVKITIAGSKVIASTALKFPSDRSTSRRINSVALPRLESEVIQAQSARVNAVTGATITSEAYIRSLAKALEAASS